MIDQTRGVKMDILKALRNPFSVCSDPATNNQDQLTLKVNQTTIKVVDNWKEESKDKADDTKEKSKNRFSMDLQAESNEDQKTQVNMKHHFVDVGGIMATLVEILKKVNIQEAVLKHKDGKTFKFLLRNLFFLNSLILSEVKDQSSDESSTRPKQFRINLDETWTSNKKQFKPTDLNSILIDFLNGILHVTPKHSCSEQ
jgi:hypothetical protein